MNGHFLTRFSLGDRVLWHGLYASVRTIVWDETGVRYELDFETKGARAIVPSQEIADTPEAA